MPLDRTEKLLTEALTELDQQGIRKSREVIITGILPPNGARGPRYLLEGEADRPFLRMNSNGYLGMALRQEIITAEEKAVDTFGTGPAAVRFISGTYLPHVELEQRLAAFHGREACLVFNSAYAAVMGLLPPLITPQTAVISDELNHNCIINATRLASPKEKFIYKHLDMEQLDGALKQAARACRRAIIVTDGIFSMRGDHAPLSTIAKLARQHDENFSENVIVVVDDSHGVGAFGNSGRGTEEYCRSGNTDLLAATLGKALGVNGGYVVSSRPVIDFLREKAPLYTYSNPISPGEAAAACRALEILDSSIGIALLSQLRQMTARFEQGIVKLGYKTIHSEHPIVPLIVRDAAIMGAMQQHLQNHRVLATCLNFPVVPHGEEEIRFQISADHTESDIDEVLAILSGFPLRK